MEETSPRTILILGGGYGGIRVALDVAKFLKSRPRLLRAWMLYVVDKAGFHTFTPNLYEMATALKEDATAWNIKRAVALEHEIIFKNLPIRYLRDYAEDIDIDRHHVGTREHGAIPYDILVLALGSETNFFNIEGLNEYALALKTAEDAIYIRNAITKTLEHSLDPRPARIIIGGGGATGVELAGELTRFIKKKCVKRLSICRPHEIDLFEAASSILTGFPPSVVTTVRKRLTRLGVAVKEKTKINAVSDRTITIESLGGSEQHIPYDVLIWAGGTRMSRLTEQIIAPRDKKGRCIVGPTLEVSATESNGVKHAQRIYALGDIACFVNPKTGQPIPGTAYIAIEQAKIVAKNIITEITDGKTRMRLHTYTPPTAYPFALPFGGKYAIFSYGALHVSGLGGWMIRLCIDLHYYLTIVSFKEAVTRWLRAVWLSIKND